MDSLSYENNISPMDWKNKGLNPLSYEKWGSLMDSVLSEKKENRFLQGKLGSVVDSISCEKKYSSLMDLLSSKYGFTVFWAI